MLGCKVIIVGTLQVYIVSLRPRLNLSTASISLRPLIGKMVEHLATEGLVRTFGMICITMIAMSFETEVQPQYMR